MMPDLDAAQRDRLQLAATSRSRAMMRHGIVLDVAGFVVIVALVMLLGPLVGLPSSPWRQPSTTAVAKSFVHRVAGRSQNLRRSAASARGRGAGGRKCLAAPPLACRRTPCSALRRASTVSPRWRGPACIVGRAARARCPRAIAGRGRRARASARSGRSACWPWPAAEVEWRRGRGLAGRCGGLLAGGAPSGILRAFERAVEGLARGPAGSRDWPRAPFSRAAPAAWNSVWRSVGAGGARRVDGALGLARSRVGGSAQAASRTVVQFSWRGDRRGHRNGTRRRRHRHMAGARRHGAASRLSRREGTWGIALAACCQVARTIGRARSSQRHGAGGARRQRAGRARARARRARRRARSSSRTRCWRRAAGCTGWRARRRDDLRRVRGIGARARRADARGGRAGPPDADAGAARARCSSRRRATRRRAPAAAVRQPRRSSSSASCCSTRSTACCGRRCCRSARSTRAVVAAARGVSRGGARRAPRRSSLFHNHPSGDPTPSPDDVELTRRLVRGGRADGHRRASTTSSSADARYCSFKRESWARSLTWPRIAVSSTASPASPATWCSARCSTPGCRSTSCRRALGSLAIELRRRVGRARAARRRVGDEVQRARASAGTTPHEHGHGASSTITHHSHGHEHHARRHHGARPCARPRPHRSLPRSSR